MMGNHEAKHFIAQLIEGDIQKHTDSDRVITRFPPEPNGYLHIGHAKAICLNFGMAKQYQGICHLRFDDTNPMKEEQHYMDAIIADLNWLGFKPDALFHAADYFDAFYQWALQLINQGQAYVCSLSNEQIREYRGTLTESGRNSPYRSRSVEENLNLFQRMAQGEFEPGRHVLRAKINMQASNLNLRDPVIYRILNVKHPHLDTVWHVYPMYDYAHCLSDYLEHITHSLCTLEFQDHRPLYDWILEQLTKPPYPQQIEFSRLNLSHTLTSKRQLKSLIDQKKVSGWDDPRLPTLVGMRRRGFPPQAICRFCRELGVSKSDSMTDMSLLEQCVRDQLNIEASRALAVLNPLKITLTNYPAGQTETITAPNHPQRSKLGERSLLFSKELYIEHDDFMEHPRAKYRRLAPNSEVRLRYAYVIRCNEVIKNEAGEVIELRCSYDPHTLGKNPEDRKVKGVIHWLSAHHALPCEVRLYERLFTVKNPGAYLQKPNQLDSVFNMDSLRILKQAWVEPSVQKASPETCYQFERLGYYCLDRYDASCEHLVFNRIVSLRSFMDEKTS